jgi:NTP pyrophosphatase (non-canonical NTP hydrolase)
MLPSLSYEKLNQALRVAIDVATVQSLYRAYLVQEMGTEEEPPALDVAFERDVVDFLSALAKDVRAAEGTALPSLTLDELVCDSFTRAQRKGFWDNHERREARDIINEKLLLIVSELTEAMEEIRANHGVDAIRYGADKPDKPEGFPIELADAMIRIADVAGWFGMDLNQAIRLKAAYNETRPRMHGKEF